MLITLLAENKKKSAPLARKTVVGRVIFLQRLVASERERLCVADTYCMRKEMTWGHATATVKHAHILVVPLGNHG